MNSPASSHIMGGCKQATGLLNRAPLVSPSAERLLEKGEVAGFGSCVRGEGME
jgi:hypothetical protein